MVRIEYSASGTAVSDFDVASHLERVERNLRTPHDTYMVFSTENIIETIRAEVAEGKISHKEICFVFKGEEIQMNEYGRINDWPAGFCDTVEEAIARILNAAHKKYNEGR